MARSNRVRSTPGCTGFSRNQKALVVDDGNSRSMLPNAGKTTVGCDRRARQFLEEFDAVHAWHHQSVRMTLAGDSQPFSASRPSAAVATEAERRTISAKSNRSDGSSSTTKT